MKGRVGPLPILPTPLPEARLQRRGRRHPIAPVLLTPVLEVQLWGSRWTLGWSTSLEVVAVVGMGVGVGGGVVGVCGPKVAPHIPPSCAGG